VSEYAGFDESALPEGACAVYIMSPDKDGPIKIGVSNNPRLRVTQLGVGHPDGLTLDAVCWLNNRETAEFVEKWLLERVLMGQRLNGEWIDLAPFNIAEIFKPMIALVAPGRIVGSYCGWISPPTEAQKELYSQPCPILCRTDPNMSTTPMPTNLD
jgi:hypothetical protein